MIKDFDFNDIEDIQIDGIDFNDYPDFCDAYIESATYKGRDLTEEELEWVMENYPDCVYEKVLESIH